MNRTQALKTIRDAIKPELQKLAYSANMYEAGYHSAPFERSYQKREKIRQAMAVLEQGAEVQMKLF